MVSQQPPSDLLVATFFVLRHAFFDEKATPRVYQLRDKRNTQDDPFDEYVHQLLSEKLPEDTTCVKAPGPLITPDLVVMRRALCNNVTRETLTPDLTRIAAIEVKKLERTSGGGIARSSGMDYNTTPPCGTVRIYDLGGRPLDIRGFYLFVCQGGVEGSHGRYRLSALALCDGNILNADFRYYLSIVGTRTKEVGLGSYNDGANRTRPMLIFANPLGAKELDHRATFIHPASNLGEQFAQLQRVGIIRRKIKTGGEYVFYCYRLRGDVPGSHRDFDLLDPFPSPARTTATQARGKFQVDLRPSG
jgi:hypothetical protein